MGNCYSTEHIAEDHIHTDITCSILSFLLPLYLALFCLSDSRRAVVSYWRKYVHEVLDTRLGSLSLPRKSVVRLTDRPDVAFCCLRGRKEHVSMRNNNSSTALERSVIDY